MGTHTIRYNGQRPPARKGKLAQSFFIREKLGQGQFAVVLKVERKSDGKFFAVKIIKKKKFKPQVLKKMYEEVRILSSLRHPNINLLIQTINTKKHIHIILQLLKGDQLFDSIVKKKCYKENEAANVIRQVARACEYIHERKIIHRDLKPQNLVYLDRSNTQICVTDFGLSKWVQNEEGLMETTCGTPGYVAPEVLKRGKYDFKVDLWSIGVILYILLCGFPPFMSKNKLALYSLIKSGNFNFPSPYWDNISLEAKDCIRKLLLVDPNERLSSTDLLKHEWISSKFSTSTKNLVPGGYEHRFTKFLLVNKFRRGVDSILFLNKLKRSLTRDEEEDLTAEKHICCMCKNSFPHLH